MITKGTDLAGAVFDDTGQYRYQLWRRESPAWLQSNGRQQRTILWVMLNPSTADEQQLDPTLRRCANYSHGWGFTAWEVCNLFAFRATDPKRMLSVVDPVGEDNDGMILEAAQRADQIVAGWGGHGTHRGRDIGVTALLKSTGKPVYCLKTVGIFSQPAHPLYLPARQQLQRYR